MPDIVDFTKGLRALVADTGRVTIEIPHLLRLIEGNEYDTIYHEHYSYLSLLTTQRVLAAAGLTVVDVEELPTHGGSLRTWSAPHASTHREPSAAVARLLGAEAAAGLDTVEGHAGFADAGGRRAQRPARVPHRLLAPRARRWWRYGAPGKGNTLLNHCGIRSDLRASSRSTATRTSTGMFLPGTHIPIHPVEALAQARPDYVLIMPWNLREEITAQLAPVRPGLGRPPRRRAPAPRGDLT